MHLYKYLTIKVFHVLACLFCLSYGWGQGTERWVGDLRLGEYRGQASYQFEGRDGDTTLTGDFRLQSTVLPTTQAGQVPYFSFQGFFDAGRPDSNWTYAFGDFRVDSGVALVDFQLQTPVSGRQHTAMVSYRDGLPAGEWMHRVKTIAGSTVQDTVFESSIRCEEGVPQGNLRLRSQDQTLLGRFLRNGYAHDVWALNFRQAPDRLEQWAFAQGQLKQITLQNGERHDTLLVYPDDLPQATSVQLDGDYFRILSLQARVDTMAYAAQGGKMAALLQQFAGYDQRVASVMRPLDSLAEPASLPMYRVKVAHYPLSERESEQLADLQALLRGIDTVSQKLLNNTRLKLLKHAEVEVNFLLATLKEISTHYLAPARRTQTLAAEKLLAFLPRRQLIKPDTAGLARIAVQYQDSAGTRQRSFVGPNPDWPEADSAELSFLLGLSRYAARCIDSIDRRLQQALRAQTYQKEVEDLEEKLLFEAEQLTQLVDSLKERMPERYASTFTALVSMANAQLRHYSAEENLSAKLALGREAITCMKESEALALTLAQLPDRWRDIQRMYTEEVWNPFTATTMEDQVKAPIPRAYHEILVPSILAQIETELTCAKPRTLQDLLDALYERVQALRKERTSKLERKLKREDDFQAVLQLFDLPMQ